MTLEKAAMTFPARRIVVADDLTPASQPAWSWARRFAMNGAHIESLFVYAMPQALLEGMPVPPLSSDDIKRIELIMRQQRPDASAWRLEPGEAPSVILRRARRANLIVLGTHGRAGLARLLRGSVSEAVVRDAVSPVLVAREASTAARAVLAPMNLQGYAEKGLTLAAEAAVFLGATLTILHVASPGIGKPNPRKILKEQLSRLPSKLRDHLQARIVVRAGNPIEVILEGARGHELLVLTAHRKSLLGDLVLGTTAERALRHAPCSVLAAPSL